MTRKRSSAGRKRQPQTKRPTSIRRSRRRFTPEERRQILASAQRDGLTGAQVAKRFGISQVSYYLWRKKARTSGSSARPRGRQGLGIRNNGLAAAVREQVRMKIAQMLPALIAEEVAAAFGDRQTRSARK